jgi:murein DD-endopeptidase MepM/ murein hydrolase activator NlpD
MNPYLGILLDKQGSRSIDLVRSIKKIKNRHLPLKEMRITAKADQQRGKVQHGAIDVGVPVGSKVYAIADAIVLGTKQLPNSKAGIYKKHGGTSSSLCGSSVALKVPHPGSPSGYTYVNYCHLSKVNPRLKKGQKIRGGTVIGLSGGKKGAPGAGNTTGPHLHMSIRPGDTRFKSNKLSAKNAVYDNWFKGAYAPGQGNFLAKASKTTNKILAYTGFTAAGLLTIYLGYRLVK